MTHAKPNIASYHSRAVKSGCLGAMAFVFLAEPMLLSLGSADVERVIGRPADLLQSRGMDAHGG